MKLQFKVLGWTLASVELEFDLPAVADEVVAAVDSIATKGVKGISRRWLRRLI